MKTKNFPEQNVIQKYQDGQSIISLSKEYNCGQGKIKRILQKNNIHIRGRSECQLKISTYIPDENVEEVRDLYNSGMSTRKLSKHYNCNRKYITDYMKRNGIVMRKDYADPVYPTLLKNKKLIIDMYADNDSILPIATYFNCSESAIMNFMDRECILRKLNICKITDVPLEDKDRIYKLHHENYYTLWQLADLYNTSRYVMRNFFIKAGIDLIDNNPITAQNRMESYKKNCYRHKKYTLPSGKIINLQGYEPQFLDYVFGNNIWKESDFDFTTFKIKYIFEGKKHYYFPDFRIQTDNLVIEVKSSYILKRQGVEKNKAKRDATISAGYNYLMVMDNDFSEILKL